MNEARAIEAGWYTLTLYLSLKQETELEFKGSQLQPELSLTLSQILMAPQ